MTNKPTFFEYMQSACLGAIIGFLCFWSWPGLCGAILGPIIFHRYCKKEESAHKKRIQEEKAYWAKEHEKDRLQRKTEKQIEQIDRRARKRDRDELLKKGLRF